MNLGNFLLGIMVGIYYMCNKIKILMWAINKQILQRLGVQISQNLKNPIKNILSKMYEIGKYVF